MHVNNVPIEMIDCEICEGVIKVGAYAFFFNHLTAVTLPSTLQIIDDWAFTSCQRLASLTFPSGLTTIGSNAFAVNMSLHSIELPESLLSIGGSAFSQSGLRSININKLGVYGQPGYGVWNNTFSWCSSLSSVTFSQNVQKEDMLLDGTFRHCLNLTEFIVPEGYNWNIKIGAQTFTDCPKLTTVDVKDDLLYIENSNFSGCTALTGVSLGVDVDDIGDYNFKGCSSIQHIDMPTTHSQGITSFEGCSSLTSITFGDKSILTGATITTKDLLLLSTDSSYKFGVGCSALTEIHVYYNGVLIKNAGTPMLETDFSSDIPENGIIYYYYKSPSETSVNSKTVADSLATLIGRGWESVSGGVVS